MGLPRGLITFLPRCGLPGALCLVILQVVRTRRLIVIYLPALLAVSLMGYGPFVSLPTLQLFPLLPCISAISGTLLIPLLGLLARVRSRRFPFFAPWHYRCCASINPCAVEVCSVLYKSGQEIQVQAEAAHQSVGDSSEQELQQDSHHGAFPSSPHLEADNAHSETSPTPPRQLDSDISLPEDAQMSHLSPAELEVWQQQFAKSVKADDAEIQVHLWDTRVWKRGFNAEAETAFRNRYQPCPLISLRRLLLRRWRRNVYLSFIKYLSLVYGTAYLEEITTNRELQADCGAGRECLWRVMESSWWEWTMGSRLLFWRWPKPHRVAARDGYPPYVQAALPSYKRPQPHEKNSEVQAKVKEKLNTVRKRKYISKGHVRNLTSYFCVPKAFLR